MSHYSEERKTAVLNKLLPPNNHLVAKVAKEEGISEATLYNWQSQAKLVGKVVLGKKKSSEQWSGEAKLAVVIETAKMNELELGEYCRKKGLYAEQIAQWKVDMIGRADARKTQRTEESKTQRADKKRIEKLEKEL